MKLKAIIGNYMKIHFFKAKTRKQLVKIRVEQLLKRIN